MRIDKKYIIQFLGVATILLSALSCNKQKTLSDGELAMIFRDAFLSNAYTSLNRLNLDSLRLYEPIFEKYGYTTADVQYTIGSFATRKSARLGDVVEQAIEMLESEGDKLDYQVSILDTIDNIAYRRTIETIYEEPILSMRTMRDTSKFVITLEDLDLGEYHITFDYYIDSLDTTDGNYFSQNWIEDRAEEVTKGKKPRQIRRKNAILNRKYISQFNSSFNVSDTTDRVIVTLANPSKKKGTPHLTIKRLSIKHSLSNDKALDSLFKQIFKVRIFDNELLFKKTDSEDSI